jgi:hypothetical protein
VLTVEFKQQRTTMMSEVYCKIKKKMLRVIQNESRGMLTSGVVLRNGNVRPYTAACTLALLEHFSYELFDHPFYSPILAPCDYHLFTHPHLKNWL